MLTKRFTVLSLFIDLYPNPCLVSPISHHVFFSPPLSLFFSLLLHYFKQINSCSNTIRQLVLKFYY